MYKWNRAGTVDVDDGMNALVEGFNGRILMLHIKRLLETVIPPWLLMEDLVPNMPSKKSGHIVWRPFSRATDGHLGCQYENLVLGLFNISVAKYVFMLRDDKAR